MRKERMSKRPVALRVALMFALILCLVLTSAGASFAVTGVNVDTHSQDEIRAMFDTVEGRHDFTVRYDERPVTSGPDYSPGKLSYETLQGALDMLNAMRYVAGIPYDVKLRDDYTQLVQAGALVNAVNDSMSHGPSKPADMAQELYQQGYKGCSSANLYWNVNNFKHAVAGWVDDINNVNGLNPGHRRWCLNPEMGYTGFGKAGAYSAMYAFDKSNSAGSSYTGVAWPAQQMPLDYFTTNEAWSISFGRSVAKESVQVALTRTRDGKCWNFSQSGADGEFMVNNDKYGQSGCVVFKPSGVGKYKQGDVFHALITEEGHVIADYYVNFFELRPVTGITLNYTSLELEPYDCESLEAGVIPANATNPKITWTSSDESVATVDEWGDVEAVGEGTATIWATDASGRISASCEVVVKEPKSIWDFYDDIKLQYEKTYYDGTAKKPSVTIEGLTKGKDYKVRYGTNKKAGYGRVSIDGIGDYENSVNIYFLIVKRPAKVSVSKLTTDSQHTVKATWKKVNCSGYQVRYSTSKSFKTYKTSTLKKGSYTSKTIKGLKKNKTYYVKVRSYRIEDDGSKTYGYFSAVKKIKCK